MPEFTDEFAKPGASPREIRRHHLSPDVEVVTFPTIGCFTRGYTLLAPISATHEFDSMAELPAKEFFRLAWLVETYRGMLRDFNSAVVVGEHGDSSTGRSCACVREAHLHVIPVFDKPIAATLLLQERGGMQDHYVRSWKDVHPLLPKNRPYVLMSPHPNSFFLWTESSKLTALGSQAIRRACAEALGIGEKFDWRRYPFESLMAQTREFVSRNIETDLRVRPLLEETS